MNAVDYAMDLIRFDSVSHRSNSDISAYVEETMQKLGCETERVEYSDAGELKVNVIGRRGEGRGGLAYFGHTDVVPADGWSIEAHGPFEPTVRAGRLYGRGSTDMKGSIACMFAAMEELQNESLHQPVYISCSADEELDHRGAIEITRRSGLYQELVTGGACGIVGEPTRLDVVYAHKGGCQIAVTSHGIAAHSSTREGVNANLAMIPFLQKMKELYEETQTDPRWLNHEFEPPSICMNIGINDHMQAVNITPPQSVCTILVRPMPTTNVAALLRRIRSAAEHYGLEFELRSQNPAFRREPASRCVQTCTEVAGRGLPRTVPFGSEAANFTRIKDLIVLGPGDIAQAHQDDEWISLEQLEQGQQLYVDLIRQFCR